MQFYKESKDKTEEEFEDTFLHWVETDALSLNRMVVETRHDLVLSRIISRIRKNIRGNCSGGRKLMIEHGVICNGGSDNSPRNTKKIGDKSVRNDIHCRIVATQKRIKLEAFG